MRKTRHRKGGRPALSPQGETRRKRRNNKKSQPQSTSTSKEGITLHTQENFFGGGKKPLVGVKKKSTYYLHRRDGFPLREARNKNRGKGIYYGRETSRGFH